MTILRDILAMQQANQAQALNQLKLAQSQSLFPIEQKLKQLQMERERQAIDLARQKAPLQIEAAEFELEEGKTAKLRDLAIQARKVYETDPELAQTIIAGGNARFNLGIEDPSQISTEDLDAFISQGYDSEQQRKMASLLSRQNEQALRMQELGLQQEKFEFGKTKLSAGLEKNLLESQETARSAMQQANEYDVLSNDFERIEMPSGVAGKFSEMLKGILGTQDDVTEFRRRFNKVRLSEGLKNLPPGPATDRDVIEAFKGVPPEDASKEQRISFLRGAARLARIDAAFHNFKSDYISEKGTAKNLSKEWRSTVFSPKLGKEVSTLEIYEAAVNKGITPEDVRERLGL